MQIILIVLHSQQPESACEEARSSVKRVNHNTGITRYIDDRDLQELQRTDECFRKDRFV